MDFESPEFELPSGSWSGYRNFSEDKGVSCSVSVKESSMLSRRFSSLVQVAVVGAIVLAGEVACSAQDSSFNLDLHANSHVTAKDIGLPVYPGATPWKEKDSDSAAN